MSIYLWTVYGCFCATASELALAPDLDSCPFVSWAEAWVLFLGFYGERSGVSCLQDIRHS